MDEREKMSVPEHFSPYVVIPSPIYFNRDIKPRAKLLYGLLSCMCNDCGYAFPRNDTLRSYLGGVSDDTVSRTLRDLEQAGAITIENGQGGNPKNIRKIYLGDFYPASLRKNAGATPRKNAEAIYCKNNIYIPPKPPQGGDNPPEPKKRRGDYKAMADVLPDRFEKFWKFYRTNCPPDANPGNRQKAIRAWDKLAPSDDLATDMARALAKQVRSAAWKKGVGVPHASTWINNHGWEDDWGSAGEDAQIPDSPGEEAAEWVT